MKQTAVEWLVEQLNEKIDFIPLDKWDMIRDIIQQAKEMEKEQIGRAYQEGLIDGMNHTPKDYYNKTYGGQV
jgi:adenylate kinase family enzyme